MGHETVVARTWDVLPPVLSDQGTFYSTRVLEHRFREMQKVAAALREYIDAIPKEIEFGVTMPGVDRDWVDGVIDAPV